MSVSCTHKAIMFFDRTESNGYTTYVFKVRVARYVTIFEFDALPIGIPHVPLPPELALMLQEVLLSCPLLIASGAQFPYSDADNIWTCPTDLKFNKASAFARVSEADFVSNSIIGWDVSSFFEAELDYIPIIEDFDSVPESIAQYEDPVVCGADGAVFFPEKSIFGGLGMVYVAYVNWSTQITWLRLDWLEIWSHQHIPTNHILTVDYATEDPYDFPPMRETPSHGRGVENYDTSSPWLPDSYYYGSETTVRCYQRQCSLPYRYYPPRTIKGGTPGHLPVLPIIINLLTTNAFFSPRGIFPLYIAGQDVYIDGEDLNM